MSIDDCEYKGAYTGLERAAGIPNLVHGGTSDSSNEKQKTSEFEALCRQQKTEVIKAISHLKTVEQVQNKVLKKLLFDNLNRMVEGYRVSEKLPSEYVRLAMQSNAMPVLLKGVIKDLINNTLTKELIEDIEKFCCTIYQNHDLEIVYDRVSYVQKFVHNLVDSIFGEGYHQTLPSKKMKYLLSASRLHLNIEDFKNLNASSLYDIVSRSKELSEKEEVSPRPVKLAPQKQYVSYWRVGHLRSILTFQDEYQKSQIASVLKINTALDIELFKQEIVNIFDIGENS